MVIAEILGPDMLIVGAVILVLLFGGAKLPELARSLGSAKSEFEKGAKEGTKDAKRTAAKTETAPTDAPTVKGDADA